MSFKIIPATIIGRLQGLNLASQTPDQPGQPPSHAGRYNEYGRYDPSPIDVAVVRIMLARAKKLPVDLVDAMFEQAEYWVRTTTAANYSARPVVVSKGSAQDKFLIRSLPVGFTSEHGGDLDLEGEPAAPKPLQSQIPAKTLAKMADYPLPKLQGPVRKVVFTITSHDQGWSGQAGPGLYENSWTWFEAGLERLEGNEIGEPRDTPPTPLDAQTLRPVYPTITDNEPSREEKQDAQWYNPAGTSDGGNEAGGDRGNNPVPAQRGFRYSFPLLHSPKWTVCRNKRAHRDWQKHEITWSCYDAVMADSDRGQALEEAGRGRESGDGEFVRNLKLGDVVTLWAKARFPGWVNSIQAASIDVYWAAT